ncbi:Inner membrane protein yqiK [Escherichia coli]|uniref:Inner membrane protein yqiK n=1 Tax=Escherichia coli TaxID=562 RepID=A0A376LBK3_ECOLX|nr:Inner membrane protein yqiK [Escherichia coli]
MQKTKAVELTVRAKAEKEAAEMQAAAIVELAEATRKKGLAEAESATCAERRYQRTF